MQLEWDLLRESSLSHLIYSAQNYKTEVPFLYKSRNSLIKGTIDFILEFPHKIILIDWKTESHLVNNQDLSSKHKQQLDYYTQAANKYFNKPVVGILYHTPTQTTYEYN
jgi:ATP-dependent exoDNAse (exonuclease V) beta subunit